jgi:hypothetical protein
MLSKESNTGTEIPDSRQTCIYSIPVYLVKQLQYCLDVVTAALSVGTEGDHKKERQDRLNNYMRHNKLRGLT